MKNKKILIIAILILAISLLSLNFEKITGFASKQPLPEVTVYKENYPKQNELNAGEKITIAVKVKDACVIPEIELRAGSKTYSGTSRPASVRQATVTQKGHVKICKNDVVLDKEKKFYLTYKTKPDWDGDYFARVYYWKERNTKEYIDAYFKVKPVEK